MRNRLRHLVLAACVTLAAAPPAWAEPGVEATWSGFATLGYARSNSDFTYQRFIDRDGTFKRDSLVAGQLDLRLNPQWSATLQMKVAPADDDDRKWSVDPAWAFVAWRPDNDWLVRAGKARVPLYLHSESLDVGLSHDMLRLPHEMYSISPTNDFTGLFVTHSFGAGEREYSVDAYSGQARATARFWLRDGLPPYMQPGASFHTVKVRITGLALTARDAQLTWRLGLHSTSEKRVDGNDLPVRFPRVDLGPGVGYWKVDESMYGPPIETTRSIRNLAFTAGAEWQIDDTWRVASEFVRMRQLDTELGSDSKAGYVALFKRIGSFTPYVSLARQRSSDGVLEWHRRLTEDRLPDMVEGAAQLNAAQRVAGETLYAFDQRSVAIGVSYAWSATARIKAEWMRTHVGATSNHFDTPAGQAGSGGLRVNTLSANVSVAF
jgi:hypothetical protein